MDGGPYRQIDAWARLMVINPGWCLGSQTKALLLQARRVEHLVCARSPMQL